MIQLLSKETIDKIAAGEVVDRPLCVVKELVENSIDAKSKAITVETEGGGSALIRVTDNGTGIEKDDCKKAFLRHATSKINKLEDLEDITTLGFRGEALSSIAAVSRLKLITKPKEDILASEVEIEGGEVKNVSECAASDGTSILVRDLFFNTPARKKFLKSDRSENAAIEDMVIRLCLSRPDISFRLISDRKERVFTSGSGDLSKAVLEVFGINTAKSVLDIECDNEICRVSGFIGKSVLNRSSRSSQYFFVNKRSVNSKILSKALEEGYLGYVMQHRFPFCILFLDFPKGSVDVNVHPQKMEVRFDNAYELSEVLRNCVNERLTKREDIESIELSNPDKPKEKKVSYEPFEEKAKSFDEYKAPIDIKRVDEYIKNDVAEKKDYENLSFLTPESKKNHRILGQVFDTYWIIEFEEKLYIMDQHAAHEKVLYERIMKRVLENSGLTQQIAPPIIVSLTPTEEETLKKNFESFIKVGYSVEHFGGRDYKITGIPATLVNNDPKELFFEIMEDGLNVNSESITKRVASISCKAAVKGNKGMSFDEARALLDELLTLDNPYHCPHGRPTFISFSRYELDKKFKRIV